MTQNTNHATQVQKVQVYDVGRINARRFAGVHITGELILRVAMGIALMVSLYAQLGHTAHVANYLSRGHDTQAEFNSYVFAVAVELSVLLLVLAGHKRISWLFATATFLTNIGYFWIVWEGQWRSANTLIAILMSLLLPAVIVAYSHSVVAHKSAEADSEIAPDANAQKQRTQSETAQTQEPEYGASDTTQLQYAATDIVWDDQDIAQNGDDETAQDENAQAGGATAQTERKERKRKSGKMTPEMRRLHIFESGLRDVDSIMAQYGVQRRMAQMDLAEVRKMSTVQNGNSAY